MYNHSTRFLHDKIFLAVIAEKPLHAQSAIKPQVYKFFKAPTHAVKTAIIGQNYSIPLHQ